MTTKLSLNFIHIPSTVFSSVFPKEFQCPELLVSCKDRKFGIAEIEEILLVLEKKTDPGVYRISDISLEEMLFEISLIEEYDCGGQSIASVLFHKDFETKKKQFIERALELDERRSPKLFNFSDKALRDIIKAGYQEKIILDPLTIIDSTGCNLIIHLAKRGSSGLLMELAMYYPEVFLLAEIQNSIIEVYAIKNGCMPFLPFRELECDRYHEMMLTVASQNILDDGFKASFELLTFEQKQLLFDIAYIHNNPNLFETADTPVGPEKYSINFIWINKDKMPSEQEFLFGETDHPDRKSFYEGFIELVSKWAKKNPDSRINIWFDGRLALPEAITRSRLALEKELADTYHAKIKFRDIYDIDLVQKHEMIFSSRFPVYYRVDLLKAIIADSMLHSDEIEYFVYSDLDVKPLSGSEIFDKRTLSFLEEHGFVMMKGLGGDDQKDTFENIFQILTKKNPAYLDLHRQYIIMHNLVESKYRRINECTVFDCYQPLFFKYLDDKGFHELNNIRHLPRKVTSAPRSKFSF